MIVKICGITNPADALAAVDGGASALGFIFHRPSPRYIDPGEARRIVGLLPPGVWKVGVFVKEPAESAAGVAALVGLDIVQLHGDCPAPHGLRIWRAIRVGPRFDPAQLAASDAEALLLDAESAGLWGGTGCTFDWTLARAPHHNIVIAGGLDDTNVRRAIAEARPWGVDACSRLESVPGRKDHNKMARFLKAAIEAAAVSA
jgi:phosphoribosylanthranilate isomerase